MSNNIIEKVQVRYLQMSDYQELKQSMIDAYSNWSGAYWREHHVSKLLEIFPEGQLGIEVNGKIVGCALSLIVDYSSFDAAHTYREITGNYTFNTHTSKGDILYGIEVFIHPDYRGYRLARRLYDARKELCEKMNLKSIVFGGRIPNYRQYAETLSPSDYIKKVKLKEIYDPVLTFQLSNDFNVVKILKNYLADDKESMGYAVAMAWNNIYYTKEKRRFSITKPVVRLGLIQWQMRTYQGLEELIEQAEFFVDAVSDYKSDFVLFPEFFNAPLMAAYNDLPVAQAVRKLADFTLPIREKFLNLAISYNINIITGSMPCIREDGSLYNVGYLCRRDGSFEEYEKIHVTPDEARQYGMVGGSKIKSFDTDCGKVGVLICYDVEFPELGRLLADEGMQILFVPFLTDTQNGYSRVRHCAQARAIENECYVAIAGCVGNLPKVHNMDIQYGQAAVFTPCDFAFPSNGIKAEATPNTEMILIADTDMDLLKELNIFGSVRNLRDRRTDLYSLTLKNS